MGLARVPQGPEGQETAPTMPTASPEDVDTVKKAIENSNSIGELEKPEDADEYLSAMLGEGEPTTESSESPTEPPKPFEKPTTEPTSSPTQPPMPPKPFEKPTTAPTDAPIQAPTGAPGDE